MRLLKFLVVFGFTIAVVVLANSHQPMGSSVPAMGKFLNPFTGFWQNAETPQTSNLNLTLEGLEENVRIQFDDRLVPHIFASNINDAYFAQGYVTAMHRLWQMDISTRAISGQLSEVLGERTLERDLYQRRKGLLTAAENALVGWKRSEEEYAMLKAYSAGVNAYIASLEPKDYPLEYKLMDFAPTEWTPLHSALFSKNMAETLCFRNYDLRLTNALKLFGEERFAFLYPEYNPKQVPIIPSDTPWPFDTLLAQPQEVIPSSLSEYIPYKDFPQPPEYIGSNNWAVSGQKTQSGHPIVCNDPHLGLTLPSIWYEVQLHIPDMNVYGVSLPGIPGVIIGFNENVAWGITNAGHDVLDWYRIEWVDEKKDRYYVDGEIYDIEPVIERIYVRAQKEVVLDTVKYTIWGPVVYSDPSSAYADYAMRWVAHDMPEEREFYDLGSFNRMNKAKNYEDYSTALTGYDSPAQNFVFASKDGDIALKVNGKLPYKETGQGNFFQEGNTMANAWKGFIPKEQVPAALNPEQGYLASANQRSTSKDYPYYYNGGFDDYRGRVINRYLSEMENISIDDMKRLQSDNYSIYAEEGTQILIGLLDSVSLSKEEASWRDRLLVWDYRFDADSKEAIVFNDWMNAVYKNTFDEIYALSDSIDLRYPEYWRLLELLEQYPQDTIFDDQRTSDREFARDIVNQALTQALEEIKDKLDDPNYTWADHNGVYIRHMANLPGFSTDVLETGGFHLALNAQRRGHGPSWRMIVELGEEVKAYGVYPGGQSGHAASPYYNNMIEQWTKGEYNELNFMKEAQSDENAILFEINLNRK